MQQGIKKLQWCEYLKVVFLEILNPLLCWVFANQVTNVYGRIYFCLFYIREYMKILLHIRTYICEITLLGFIKNSQRCNFFTSIFTEECVGAGSKSDEYV